MAPWDCRIYRLIREYAADRGLPQTPSAVAFRAYLEGRGQLQTGSWLDPRCDRVWFRPLGQGRSDVVKSCCLTETASGGPAGPSC